MLVNEWPNGCLLGETVYFILLEVAMLVRSWITVGLWQLLKREVK